MVSSTEITKKKRTIENASITWGSTKTQMVFSILLIIASCFVAYCQTLSMGFLLDDFLHLDYCARALGGDATTLINNLTSNWGGSDIMKSYRPTISFSIFFDYLLFHTNAAGYHLTNLIIFTVCSVMVGLVTLEIADRINARTPALAALWAGLLFSVYPLHAESVAWIIGRVDSLATVFYLASVFCFLRLQRLHEKGYLIAALVFFVLSLTSKEIAVSLPVAIAFLALLPQKNELESTGTLLQTSRQKFKSAFFAVTPFIILLAAYALFRQCLLGTAVGGYGGSKQGFLDILASLKIFADRDSLTKILVPISEEFQPVRAFAPYCLAPLIVIAAAFLGRQLTMLAQSKYKWTAVIAPALTIVWLALALVPAFQIWHIYPNLVGSRLFFLSSAGLCAAIALTAVPLVEPLSRKAFNPFAVLSLAALTALYLAWFYILSVNLGAWKQASTLMTAFESQLRQTMQQAPQSKIVVLNLPQDYKGAGMLGRKLYLDIANKPPFFGQDLSTRLLVLEPKITGSKDFIWPHELSAVTSAPNTKTFIWSSKDGTLTPFEAKLADRQSPVQPDNSNGNGLADTFARSLKSLPTMQDGQWQAVSVNKPVVRKDGAYTELQLAQALDAPSAPAHDGSSVVTFWLDQGENKDAQKASNIDPRNPNNWLLTLDVQDENGLGMISRCQAIWRDSKSGEILGEASPYLDRHRGQYLFYLGRYRSYLLSKNKVQLGLRFNLADHCLHLKPESLKLGPDTASVPSLTMDSTKGELLWDATALTKDSGSNGYDQVRFYVTAPGTTIDPVGEYDLYQPAALEKLKPELVLPLNKEAHGNQPIANLIATTQHENPGKSHAVYQIVIVVTGKGGKIQSLPSTPVTIGD